MSFIRNTGCCKTDMPKGKLFLNEECDVVISPDGTVNAVRYRQLVRP